MYLVNMIYKKRVDCIALLEPGIPFFIIIDKLEIQEFCDLFTVLNDESRILLLNKIIDTFTIIEKTFLNDNKSNVVNNSGVNDINENINDKEVINI